MKNKKRNLLAFLIFFLANTLFLPLCSVFAEENAEPPVVDSSANKTATSKNSTSPEALAQEQSSKKSLTSGTDSPSVSSGSDSTEASKNSSNKYSAPVNEGELEVKATAPEKKKEEKKLAQSNSVILAQNNETPSAQKPPVEPPQAKKSNSSLAPGETKNNNEKYEPKFEGNGQTPADLPEVDAQEVNLPQVIAKQDDAKSSVNILFIIAAWCLIALGVLVVIFVILNGKRHRAGVKIFGRKKGRKGNLLSGGFYKK